MNKVTMINLNGNAHQLEESGYEALRDYLENAARQLKGNPDKDEIIADIEQAIADKFRAVLGPHKTVVAAGEVDRIIAEMGPVQDASGPAGGGDSAPGAPERSSRTGAAGEAFGSPRRLYKIKEGAMLGGVCNGLASYFNIDVSIVRIVFTLLTVMWGFGALIYLLMLIVIPAANTSEEKAAATGGGPSTAEEFIRRAKAGYYEGMKTFKDKRAHREWKRKFKQEMRGWKSDFQREMQDNAKRWKQNWHHAWPQHSGFACGLAVPFAFLSLFYILITLLGLYAAFSLLAKGVVFGVHLPDGIPVWVGIVALILICKTLTWPFRAARRARYYGGYGAGSCGLWDSVIWVGFILLIVWFANRHSLRAHEALENVRPALNHALDSVKQALDKL